MARGGAPHIRRKITSDVHIHDSLRSPSDYPPASAIKLKSELSVLGKDLLFHTPCYVLGKPHQPEERLGSR